MPKTCNSSFNGRSEFCINASEAAEENSSEILPSSFYLVNSLLDSVIACFLTIESESIDIEIF